MIANDILLDAFTRVHESLHRTLGDITPKELVKEPHPSIGWLAWLAMERIPNARAIVRRLLRRPAGVNATPVSAPVVDG